MTIIVAGDSKSIIAEKDAEIARLNAAVAEYKAMWNKEATDHLTTYALVAAAYRAAADVCEGKAEFCYPSTALLLQANAEEIRALTTADAERKLRGLCLEVAKRRTQADAMGYTDAAYQVSDEAIVDEVLK